MSLEILLPAATEFVETAEVPGLIAAALHPHIEEERRTLAYFVKVVREGTLPNEVEWNGWPLNNHELLELQTLWPDLQPVPEDASPEELEPYFAAFEKRGKHLDWQLDACWKNHQLNSDIQRHLAETEHRSELIAAIRDRRLNPLSATSRLATDESNPASVITTKEFQAYAEKFGIPVRVQGVDFELSLRARLSQATHWEERELEALCFGIPPDAYASAAVAENERIRVRDQIRKALESGRLHAEETHSGNPLYGGQWNIERISALRWVAGKYPKFPGWLVAKDLPEIWKRQEYERQDAGRYTLEEAAKLISGNAMVDVGTMLNKLIKAAESNGFPVFRPGETASDNAPTRQVRAFYHEAYWDDLNHWLGANEARILWRFPIPKSALRAPKWSTWRDVPKAELWECCALSCNISPDGMPGYLDEKGQLVYPVGFIVARSLLKGTMDVPIEPEELQRRLTIARKSVGPGGDLDAIPNSNGPEVKISIFAAWAVAKGWKIPQELRALARTNLKEHANISVERPVTRTLAQEQFILTELRSLGIEPMKLPKSAAGKPGIKSEIRARAMLHPKIFLSANVFEKAWDRLRAEKSLVDARQTTE